MGNTLLHRARREAGYRSAADFARVVGLDGRLWQDCELGIADTPDQALARVAEALGVPELEVLMMSADAQLEGRYAGEVGVEAPRPKDLEALANSLARGVDPKGPRMFLFPDGGKWTAIDASDMSLTFTESFKTREAAAAWLLKPGLEADALRRREAGNGAAALPSPTRLATPAPERHVALEIDAAWARSVAEELGVDLTDEEAKDMSRCAADNLWNSDILSEIVHDQLVAEIESYDEDRRAENDRGRTPPSLCVEASGTRADLERWGRGR